MFRKFSKNSGKSIKDIETIYSRSSARRSFEKGKVTSDEFYNSMKEGMKLKMGFSEFKKIYTGIFSHNKEIEKIIPKLKKKYRLVLLSNTDEMHYGFIRKRFKILDYFDDFVLSYEEGCRKPNPVILLKAIKKANAMPWNCVYFDDIKEFVWIARMMGIKSFRYNFKQKINVIL